MVPIHTNQEGFCRPLTWAAKGRCAMIHVKTILYPTDFSPYSNQAYFHAVALAENHGASLTILYVHTPGGVAYNASADPGHWRGQLEQVRPLNQRIPVHHVFLEGDPATEIIRYATASN